MTPLLLRYHRLLGLLAVLPLLLWGLSGMSHPLMSRLQAKPAAFAPPAELLAVPTAAEQASLPAPRPLLQASGLEDVTELRLLRWQGRLLWQLSLPGQAERRYLDAHSGQELPGLDAELAVYLARHFSGQGQAAISGQQLQTDFDSRYLSVNRLLPVWRVDFAGPAGLSVYVETAPARLASLSDSRQRQLQGLFRQLHSWAFISQEALRDVLMSGFLLAALATSLAGLWLYGGLGGGRRLPTGRRWHRRLGLLVGLAACAFAGSGLYHLWALSKSLPPGLQPGSLAQAMPVGQLSLSPAALPALAGQSLSLVSLGGEPYYRLSASPARGVAGRGLALGERQAGHDHHGAHALPPEPAQALYISAHSGEALAQGEAQHALRLAQALSGLPAEQLLPPQPVTAFTGEYGFINKRLPVWRVDSTRADGLSLYVETQSGQAAALVNNNARREGWSFAYLHKWQFMDVAGKNVRDALAASVALLIVLCAGLGLWLALRRRA